MPKHNTVLKRQTRKMVHDVHCYLKMETDGFIDTLNQIKSEVDSVTATKVNTLISDLRKIQKRTANATKVSVATIRKLSTEASKSDLLTVFRTPGKKRLRTKPITGLDNFDQGVIKRAIHNFHKVNNELPTVEKLKKKLEEDINYKGSERSLRRILKDLGFRWKSTENNRKVLIESSYIRLQRIEYLRKIKVYRQEGRSIVYTDESYVDSSHSTPKQWTDGSSKGLKKPISKGQRAVIVHAGSESGFIPNALLTFKAGTKSGDYHDNMNYENYELWLKSQLIPNLPPNSVVVVDNASYHNKQYDRAPTSNAKKADMQAWLTEKGIMYDTAYLKPQLYNLIKANKERFKTFSIDQILAEHNHQILRLPPYHPDLNPIEMAWSTIKQYVASKNVTWNLNKCIELIKEKVAKMGEQEWTILCQKVKNIEEEYAKSDHVVDMMTEQFIIYVDEESSETDTDSDGVDNDSTDECKSPEPGPSTSKRLCTIEGVHPLSESE